MAQRPPLSLTAELEKLEQSITLTLQEIDHNFSRTHRIVTTSIIPIVERYAKESEAVWEGSKFWKQFFEASANVALSNYQEEETYDQTQTETTRETYTTYEETSSPVNYEQTVTRLEDDETERIAEGGSDDDLIDDSLLESLDLTGGAHHSTPKAKNPRNRKASAATWANTESPFKRELTTNDYSVDSSGQMFPPTMNTQNLNLPEDSSLPPSTPPSTRFPPQPRGEFTLDSSPFSEPPSTVQRTGAVNEDQLLHRVLDKNWRLQATPLGKPRATRYKNALPSATPKRTNILFPPETDSPLASPPKPHLHTNIFSSPPRGGGDEDPKTPTSKRNTSRKLNYGYEDSDSDDDLILPPGFSPPVTIQFSLPPSKLLATPAREASKRIVRNILQTAGAVDESGTTNSSPPTFIRERSPGSDDTF